MVNISSGFAMLLRPELTAVDCTFIMAIDRGIYRYQNSKYVRNKRVPVPNKPDEASISTWTRLFSERSRPSPSMSIQAPPRDCPESIEAECNIRFQSLDQKRVYKGKKKNRIYRPDWEHPLDPFFIDTTRPKHLNYVSWPWFSCWKAIKTNIRRLSNQRTCFITWSRFD